MARPSNKSQDRPVVAGERRASARLGPADIPFLKKVKPTGARDGRLVDISQSGVLLETTARLLPGRRSTMLLITDTDQRERVEAIVVRAQLVGIARGGELTYRVGLTFAKPLPKHLSEAVDRGVAAKVARSKTAAVPTNPREVPLDPDTLVARVAQARQLSGPFDSLWASATGSELLAVAQVSETGCVAQTPAGADVGDRWSVRIFFSAARQLTLDGSITSLTPDGQCVFTFDELSVEDRRMLRVEIRGGRRKSKAAEATARSEAERIPQTNLAIHLASSTVSLTANQ